ncbi:MAG: glycosyltransferase family 2 protein [Thermoleophilia bacterium]|nr:glycosyltransferase family 2 protein [Thermoleophilia bacterium]
MTEVLSVIVLGDQLVLLVLALYFLVISLAGLLPFPRPAKVIEADHLPRFLCLTMAHNEEAVIGEHVRSLLAMVYPRARFDVVVAADNCTDGTAGIAQRQGAEVWPRTNLGERGKGHALRWAYYKRADLGSYDAVCVFDADNLVEPNFLMEMANELTQGHEVIQAYLDTKNPHDSWVSASYASAYWYMNRFWQRARSRIGLSGALGGTGFCVSTRLLQTLPWETGSLTEDLEYSTHVVTSGSRVRWTPWTRVYDEKPVTMMQSLPQRVRWLKGHWSTAFRYSWRLIRAMFSGSLGQRLRAFDFLVYLWQPLVILFTGLNLLLMLVELLAPQAYSVWLEGVIPFPIWFALVAAGLFMPLLAFALEDADWFSFLHYPAFLLFNLTWIPISLVGLARHRDRRWSHTRHTRSVAYEELAAATEPKPAMAPKAVEELKASCGVEEG